MLEMDIRILNISRFSIPNDETGEVFEKAKVRYISKEVNESEDSFGYDIGKGLIDYNEFEKLKKHLETNKLKLPFDCKGKFAITGEGSKISLKEIVY